MKKIFTLLLLIPLVTIAQKKEVVYKKLANITCECANRKGASEITETDLGLCIFESLDKLNDKEKKVIGYNPDKKMETIEKVAESVGIEMAIVCPEVFSKLAENESGDATEAVEEAEDLFATGTLESIASNEFKTINMVDENNAKRAFIWLFSFEGDALFIKNKASKGDKLEIHYREQEFFDPKTNSYQKYNEITEIKLL
jgi:hypothetical protein